MKIHNIKYMGTELCDSVYSGAKLYEIRKNDRGYEVGDLIYPLPVGEDGNPIEHPLGSCIYRITHIITEWEGALKRVLCLV